MSQWLCLFVCLFVCLFSPFLARFQCGALVLPTIGCDPLTLIPSRTFPRMSANALITAFPALRCAAMRAVPMCRCCSAQLAAMQHAVRSHNALQGCAVETFSRLWLWALCTSGAHCHALHTRLPPKLHCGVVIYRFPPKCIIFTQRSRKHLFSMDLCNHNDGKCSHL